MEVDQLLKEARKIWGDKKLSPEEMLIRLGVVFGDMNRVVRDAQENGTLDDGELKKEMGNVIFSMIRWCDDLGYDPAECIVLARQAQQNYKKKLRG